MKDQEEIDIHKCYSNNKRAALFSIYNTSMERFELTRSTNIDPDFQPTERVTEDLSQLNLFQFSLLAIACFSMPTGMIRNTQLANEANAVYYSLSLEDIELPEKYVPTNEAEQAAADAWLEAELERRREQRVKELDIEDDKNTALALAIGGAIANIGAVLPAYFSKTKKSGKFDLIEE